MRLETNKMQNILGKIERERERESKRDSPSFYLFKFFLKAPFLTALFYLPRSEREAFYYWGY